MGQVSLAVYKPRDGRENDLLEIIKEHLPILRAEGLASDYPVTVLKTSTGSFIEIFEWISEKAINDAHNNSNVQKLSERFNEVCEYIPFGNLDEAKDLFATFEQVNISSQMEYASESVAVNELGQLGYDCNFTIKEDRLHCVDKNLDLRAEEFEIDKIYRYEGDSNPSDETVVYAISSAKYAVKGTLVLAYGTYAEAGSGEIMRKISSQAH